MEGGATAGAASYREPVTHISSLARLDQAIDELGALLGQIEGLLEPVMQPLEPQPVDDRLMAIGGPQSPLANRADTINDRNVWLRKIIARIDI